MLMISAGSLFMASRSEPTWYAPPEIDVVMVEQARRTLPDAYQQFTDALVAGEPFEFRLSDAMVNEWLATREEIWPDVADAIPQEVSEPVVSFDEGRVAVAARVRIVGVNTIVSLRVSGSPDDAWFTIDPATVLAGSVPVPMGTIGRIVERFQTSRVDLREFRQRDDPARSVGGVTELIDGFAVRNLFYWSNGERYFRISDIAAEGGWLTLAIEPVP